jgi:ornithine cyclodeaminase/alanine dehydrogenase-like protein (mu-crystallin family)
VTKESHVKPDYLTDADVAELLSPAEAVEAIEACFRRMAAGEVHNRPR